jgi:hypothetical protein
MKQPEVHGPATAETGTVNELSAYTLFPYPAKKRVSTVVSFVTYIRPNPIEGDLSSSFIPALLPRPLEPEATVRRPPFYFSSSSSFSRRPAFKHWMSAMSSCWVSTAPNLMYGATAISIAIL